MSALGQKQTADMCSAQANVRLVPIEYIAEGAECARLLYGWCAATPGHLHLQFCGHGRAAILLEGGVELR